MNATPEHNSQNLAVVLAFGRSENDFVSPETDLRFSFTLTVVVSNSLFMLSIHLPFQYCCSSTILLSKQLNSLCLFDQL